MKKTVKKTAVLKKEWVPKFDIGEVVVVTKTGAMVGVVEANGKDEYFVKPINVKGNKNSFAVKESDLEFPETDIDDPSDQDEVPVVFIPAKTSKKAPAEKPKSKKVFSEDELQDMRIAAITGYCESVHVNLDELKRLAELSCKLNKTTFNQKEKNRTKLIDIFLENYWHDVFHILDSVSPLVKKGEKSTTFKELFLKSLAPDEKALFDGVMEQPKKKEKSGKSESGKYWEVYDPEVFVTDANEFRLYEEAGKLQVYRRMESSPTGVSRGVTVDTSDMSEDEAKVMLFAVVSALKDSCFDKRFAEVVVLAEKMFNEVK